jgi:hypothetical protein
MTKQDLMSVINLLIKYLNDIDSEHIIKIINILGQEFSYKELQELGLESEDD